MPKSGSLPFLDPNSLWAMLPSAAEFLSDRLLLMDPEKLLAFWDDEDDEPTTKTDTKPYAVENGIALLSLKGPLIQGGGWLLRWIGGTDPDDYTAVYSQAVADGDVERIFTDVDSPGGYIGGIHDGYEAVLAGSKIKPSYAYNGGQMASAALWMMAGCTQLLGSMTSETGSIGVCQRLMDTSEMHKRLGIKVEMLSSGKYKGAGLSNAVPLTDEQRQHFQSQIDTMADIFRGAVGRGRHLDKAAVAKISDGRTWIGKDAVKAQLLDGIGSRGSVLSHLGEMKPGRKTINIAASISERAAQEEPMGWVDKLKAAIGIIEEEEAKTPPTSNNATANPQPMALVVGTLQPSNAMANFSDGKLIQDKEIDDLKKALAKSEEEKVAMAETVKKSAEDANRAAVMAYYKLGHLAMSEVDAHVALRAKSPDVYDAMIVTQKPSALHPGAGKGVDAAAASAKMEEETPTDAFLAAAKEYQVGRVSKGSSAKPQTKEDK